MHWWAAVVPGTQDSGMAPGETRFPQRAASLAHTVPYPADSPPSPRTLGGRVQPKPLGRCAVTLTSAAPRSDRDTCAHTTASPTQSQEYCGRGGGNILTAPPGG